MYPKSPHLLFLLLLLLLHLPIPSTYHSFIMRLLSKERHIYLRFEESFDRDITKFGLEVMRNRPIIISVCILLFFSLSLSNVA